MKTISRPSPNFDARPQGAAIDILVLHYTGMKTAAAALERLCDRSARVSAHYTVDEDGTIYAHVAEEALAFHAGISYWAGATDINGRSVGIEIVNPGHEFGYRAFPAAQVAAVTGLARDVVSRRGIRPERVLGHSDVAPARKSDPGELFPWRLLAEAGVGLWPGVPPHLLGASHLASLSPSGGEGRGEGDFEDGLRRFGYGIGPDGAASLEQAVIAFQRHFRPAKIDGMADAECERILASLLAALDPAS